MCHSQTVRETRDTINFSALGVIIVFASGTFLVLLSYVLDTLTATLQRYLKKGAPKAAMWQRDEVLRTLRALFESNSRGIWRASSAAIPTTMPADEVFFYPDSSHGLIHETYEAVSKKASNCSSGPPRKATTS